MILVTGANGFIGMHTTKAFVDAGESVVMGYNSARREPEFLEDQIGKRVFPEPVNVADRGQIDAAIQKHGVTGIVHLAMPGYGKFDAAGDYATNMPGLLNVLEATREHGLRRLTIMSSSAVYESVPEGPFQEDVGVSMESHSPTEAYKKAWEILAGHFADRANISIAAARVPGIYGPMYYSMKNVASRLCHAGARGTTPDFEGAIGGVPKADTEWDFCFVNDCARGLVLIHQADSLRHRAYNIGPGRAATTREIAEAVLEVSPDTPISLERGGGPSQSRYLDISRSRSELGYEPEYDIHRGVATYVGWLAKHDQ